MGQETKWVKPLFDKQRGLTQYCSARRSCWHSLGLVE